MKNNRGNTFIEWLLLLPMIIMIISFGIEMGFAMYDFSTINYAASSMAVEAARKGGFDQDVYSRGAAYLQSWTTGGKDITVYHASSNWAGWPDDCRQGPDSCFIWAPELNTSFPRGQVITVGVCYPVQFKLIYMEKLGHWILGDNLLYLKAKPSALSEPFQA
mgnify:FL=1